MADDTIPLAGIDLAWQSERNASAIAVGTLTGRRLHIDAAEGGIVSLEAVTDWLKQHGEIHGIAIDAPLIIKNAEGRRPCEGALGADYRARYAGCHPANLKLYPDAGSVRLAEHLAARGFKHLGERDRPWQVECYPHPAIIELFDLPVRLAYKKGNVKQKRGGQIRFAELLCDPSRQHGIEVSFADSLAPCFDGERIATLRGKALKHNEDILDAMVCLTIAAHYQANLPMRHYGDTLSGYIVVPAPAR